MARFKQYQDKAWKSGRRFKNAKMQATKPGMQAGAGAKIEARRKAREATAAVDYPFSCEHRDRRAGYCESCLQSQGYAPVPETLKKAGTTDLWSVLVSSGHLFDYHPKRGFERAGGRRLLAEFGYPEIHPQYVSRHFEVTFALLERLEAVHPFGTKRGKVLKLLLGAGGGSVRERLRTAEAPRASAELLKVFVGQLLKEA